MFKTSDGTLWFPDDRDLGTGGKHDRSRRMIVSQVSDSLGEKVGTVLKPRASY